MTVYAVEDGLPTGWTADSGQITQGGTYDSLNRKVKWGPFYDNVPRLLTYAALPGTNTAPALFTGTASFDGVDVAITGQRTSTRAPFVRRDSNDNRDVKRDGFRLLIQGEEGLSYLLEYTTDLIQWLPLSTNVVGAVDLEIVDPSPASQSRRFYRITER